MRRNVLGGRFHVIWGGERGDKKCKKIKQILTLGGRQMMSSTQQPTKNKHAQRRGPSIGRVTRRGHDRGSIDSISG
jgi:hypothetical protein